MWVKKSYYSFVFAFICTAAAAAIRPDAGKHGTGWARHATT
jgi:hypothetical protein